MATSLQAEDTATGGPAPAADIRCVGIRKTYGDVVAVEHLDLEIERGEFFTLLGPSGSGKTTTLRMIAGFEVPDEGQILLGGVDVARKPPYERDVNTVFQDYALFPHMTVAQNVALAWLLEPGDHPQRRRLAAARRAEQREELAAADLEVEVVDGHEVAEALRDARQGDAGSTRLHLYAGYAFGVASDKWQTSQNVQQALYKVYKPNEGS